MAPSTPTVTPATSFSAEEWVKRAKYLTGVLKMSLKGGSPSDKRTAAIQLGDYLVHVLVHFLKPLLTPFLLYTG